MSAQTPTLTTANSSISLVVAGLLTTPFTLQGYAADDVTSMEPVESAEVIIGVDGKMSYGWKPTIKKQSYFLQADSPSIANFDTWWAAQEAAQEVYTASGTILFPSVGVSWVCTNGVLMGYTVIPDAKTYLQPRRFIIHWNTVLPAPSP